MRGRDFLRVSDDKSGQARSNSQQHGDNLAQGEDWGVTSWLPSYSEVGSASVHRRKARADFPQLLEDLASGAFGADVLVLWEASRGSRELEEWLPLLKACARARVMIGVTNLERLFRPWKPQDRHDLIDLANDAELEVAKSRGRVTRATAAAAVEGRPHGRAPFGYQRVYSSTTGRVSQVEHPEEGALVRELFRRLEQGHALNAIASDWQARGVLSRGTPKVPARPIQPHVLRSMALAPCYIARRVSGPQEWDRCVRSLKAQTYPADWPPLVTEERFYAVRARLTDPGRKTTRPGRGVHLLSMIARCHCGAWLTAAYRGGRRVYQCHDRGCVTIGADALDGWATRQLLGYLSREDVFEALLDQGGGADLQEARDTAARLEAERAALVERARTDRSLDPAMALALSTRLGEDLSAAQARVEELSTPVRLRGLITPGATAEAEWKGAEMPTKREVARALFTPGLLGELSVARAVSRAQISVEERVRLGGQPLNVSAS